MENSYHLIRFVLTEFRVHYMRTLTPGSAAGRPLIFKEMKMFFLAIPAILETIVVVATTTIVAKAASDLYDKAVETSNKPKNND